MLNNGPKTTGEICEGFDNISRYAVMKHLTILEEANLVLVRRKGRQRLNFLNAISLQNMADRWISHVQSNVSSSLLTLQSTIERALFKWITNLS
ncbi:ArsR/SmtB family transcription factor [Guptibacillus hwajinpoensis]|uniref:ArsR/SmtB family transcription factor n=1 Tax=Guptibacillus hwajinpoensis TaxID=208199 RepID=UPI001CFD24C8|nr:helix-turn-helix domain-containing protein [Pseudalkalibacillus hwajinpoensis]WLR61229.1 helix-turn-helix domain-containing protein [Pseudalkalibacillus hwajinpoensis]